MRKIHRGVVAVFAIGCGGVSTGDETTGRDGATGIQQPSSDASDDAIGFDEGPCGTAVSGYLLCGGPTGCFEDASAGEGAVCGSCINQQLGIDASIVSLCETLTVNSAVQSSLGNELCTDDFALYYMTPDLVASSVYEIEVPFQVANSLATNGIPKQVRYCDFSPWQGDDLPPITSCPTFNTFSICGGPCGTCPSGSTCRGRSFNHPYGLCLPTAAIDCTYKECPSGLSCFQYSNVNNDDAGTQLAEAYRVCIPSSSCAELQSSYPGGAWCIEDAGAFLYLEDGAVNVRDGGGTP